MATTTLTLLPIPGPSTGHRPARPATNTDLPTAAIQSAPAYHQQANTPLSNLAGATSTTPTVSRPTSPSPTFASHAVVPPVPHPTPPPNSTSGSSNAIPPTGRSLSRKIATIIRHCIKFGEKAAVFIAVAFTIASFVRDYLNKTKDSGPSEQEAWQNYIRFRSSCEEDLRRGQRSDDCDRELSKPTIPPPGLFKRTIPGEEIQPEFELMDYLSQRNVTLIILAIMVVVSIVRKRFCKSHYETPNVHLVKQPSTSANKSQPCAVDDPKSYLANHISSSVDEGNGTQTCPSSQPQPHSFDNLKRQLTKHTSASMDEGNGTQPRPSSHPTSDPAEHALMPTIKQPKDWTSVLLLLSVIALLAPWCLEMYAQVDPEMERLVIPAKLAGICIALVPSLLLSASYMGVHH